MEPRRTPAAGRILFSLAALTALLFLSWLGLQPPAPRPATIPANQFSGARARSILQTILGDGSPHPTGSTANDDVRQRIMTLLAQYGYAPEIHPGFSCDEAGDCAYVNNIVARLAGREPGASVLLSCHYDSVATGPGASDDGAGVATVLEIARALKTFPQPRHSIIFLIDDGEEAGLLGAHVFADQDAWAKDVGADVNIDSRGTSGSSWMFETGSANQWIVRLLARTLPFPSANSVSYTIYKQLPNDTDFTVFKAAGMQGANFANIGSVVHYHTPLDNFDNVDLRTLQHHGDNAFPLVLSLANANLDSFPASEAVYFDLFGRKILWWPSRLAPLFGWLTLILIGLEAAWLLRRRVMTPEAFGWGLLLWPVVILLSFFLGVLLQFLLRHAGPFPVLWVAYPLPAEIAFASLGVAVAVLVALQIAKRSGFAGSWAGVWVWWSVVGVLTASVAPGFSYLWFLPSACAAIFGVLYSLRSEEPAWPATLAAIAPLLVAALVLLPFTLTLYPALGARALAGIALLAALLITAAAPLLASLDDSSSLLRLGLRAVPLAVLALGIAAAFVVPVFSAQAPERLNFRYWLDADAGKAQWVAEPDSGHLPDAIRLAATFQRHARGPFHWSVATSFQSDAPALDLAAPTFTILQSTVSGNTHSYRALLRSERGAPAASVLFPPSAQIDNVRMEGWPLQPETSAVRRYFNGWWLYDCVTMPAQGVELTFELPVGKPVEVWVADRNYGLPPDGAFLLKARPLAATQSDEGDLTVVTRRVELLP
ncbi:MAG TPA: M28 family peptidase [Candidatus Acidoferrum sp.]|nr:M28 family peptidase [Candidatus Acidoferrum sp.]